MARVVEMPKLSDTMEEGGIAHWLKKEGDAVKEGEPLVEIETDKATQEYEAPSSGFLLKIMVTQGQRVPLRTPIAVIGAKGEATDVENRPGPAVPKAAAVSDGAVKPKSVGPAAPPVVAARQPEVKASSEGRIKASPLARKMAAASGLDLGHVSGSGPGGRIIQRDITSALDTGHTSTARPAPAEDLVVPVSMMRKTIAKRLTTAKNEAPHFYLTVAADMTRAEEWRGRLNAEVKKGDGAPAKISVNDIVTFMVSRALTLHPMVNASWQGETIIQHRAIHLATAVALPEGLVTPVVRGADSLSLRSMATMVRELAERARAGKLSNEDFAGGTFTISNLGMFGVEEFTAIINPPQAAILAVGAVHTMPAVDDDGHVVVRPRMKMTMSCDHRVVDGATGARFLQTLVAYLEDPLRVLV